MNRIAARILVIHLLLVCHQIDARWSLSESLSNNKAEKSMEDIFDEIRHHKSIDDDEDAGTKSCKMDFVEHDDTILRTRDSMNNGAVFMNAVHLETADACRDQCCHTRENGRYCDLAVYQDSDLDEDSDESRCFLFSCVDEHGVDNCKTAPKQEYVVFRMKIKEKVADELLDVLANFTPNPTQSIAKEDLDHPSDCNDDFTVETGFVIQPESIADGALLLKESGVATSLSTCQSQCCELKSEVSNRYCDFVVYRENLNPNSDKKKQQRCFLFSCTDQNGKFHCTTKPNKDYSVSRRIKPLRKNDIEIIRNASSTQAISTLASDKSTTAKLIGTRKTPTSAMLTTISPNSAARHDFKKTTKCSRLMWQCDNGDCIKVTNVCNGIPNCRDGSDEEGCDVLDDRKLTKSWTSPLVREFTSLPVISSSTPTASSSTESMSKSTTAPSPEAPHMDPHNSIKVISGRTEPQKGAVLPLALGLSVTICVLLIVVCRLQLLKRKTRRRGKPLSMEESDYLINGMYL